MKEENENNQTGKDQGNFGLPEGYFNASAQSIFDKIAWEEEQRGFPALRALERTSGFDVPEHYFEKTEQKIELLSYPALAASQKIHPFEVPTNYFEDNGLLVTLTESQELTVLDSFGKDNVFAVPENYFQESGARLHKKLNSAKIIPLFSWRLGMAAAALVVLVLGLWLYNLSLAPVAPEDCGTIACLEKQDLVKGTSLERMEDDELYELVDPSKLEQKLENQTNTKQDAGIGEDSSMSVSEEFLDDI